MQYVTWRRVIFLGIGLLLTESPRVLAGCNGNGDDDATDIAGGFSMDCDLNGIPDECDVAPLFFASRQEPLVVNRFGRAVRAGDLDLDGTVDLVVGSRSIAGASTVVVFSGAGDGFAAGAAFEAGEGLASMTLVDLDADGDLDVVAAGSVGLVTLLNITAGGAAIQFAALTLHAVDEETRFVAAGDLTGDGFPELVTPQADTGTVAVLANHGDGSFAPPQPIPAGDSPQAVVVADLDADGDGDLAVAHSNPGRVVVLLNAGGGTFAEPVAHDTGLARPFAVLAGRLDADEAVDLAVADSLGVALLINEGQGSFGLPVSFALTGTVSSVSTTDLEGDGDLDVAVGFSRAEEIAFLLGDGSATHRVAVKRQGDLSGSAALLGCDFDGDGDAELALLTASRLRIAWNVDENEASLPFRGERFRVEGEPHTATLGDIDGDGDLDVVTGNNFEGVSIVRNRGDGTFGAASKIQLRGSAFSILTADVDGDGDFDVATSDLGGGLVRVLANAGEGTFAAPVEHRAGSGPFHVTAGDVDGDGAPDLVTANVSGNNTSLLRNRGDGTFEEPRNTQVGSGPMAAAVADLDGDGDLDLATANTGSSSVSVLWNDGDGGLAGRVDLQLSGQPTFVIAADVDGDGRPDLVTANQQEGSVSAFWNAGLSNPGDAPATLFESAVRFDLGQAPFSLLAIDTDGDRDLDIVTSNLTDDTVSLLLNSGDRSFEVTAPIPVGGEPRFTLAGDLDGDGDIDIISANHRDRDLLVLFNQASALAGNYLELICTPADFYKVSVAARAQGVERVGKFIAPARDGPDFLPPLFQDVRHFPLHEDFLIESFPERFGDLTFEDYNALVARRATREYFVGTLSRLWTDDGTLYAFTAVADTGFDAREVLGLDEITRLYERLGRAFTLGPLGYSPDTRAATEEAATWVDPPFPVISLEQGPTVDYEAYTRATGYGRVRLMTLEGFREANARGRLTFQDILVVDHAPRDIEGIVGGVITGAVQGDLSHLTIRTARRGTPNAFVAGAVKAFSAYEGQLVRLEVFATEYFVTEVMLEEAEAFWATNRRELASPPTLDPDYRGLDQLLEMDLSGVDGLPPVARYGGKATNLARLQRILTGDYERYRLEGFAIPVHYYLAFMNTNRVLVDGVEVTFQERLDAILASPEFLSDSQKRFEALEDFRALLREEGDVDPELVEALVGRVEDVFDSTTRRLRFRSSSNVEDALEFNGAGLYESTSVCVADTLDDDDDGPSRCDSTRENERTIERALKKVWASLWTFRAHEERTFFRIPPERAAMGILVNRAFVDETANGVAFTGSPADPRERRYVITAQVGEDSVVSPEPGTSVERTLLDVREGQVVEIVRARGSSLVEPGAEVISDAHLEELAGLMFHVDENLPIELGEYAREQVLLDFEFKVEPGGSLAVKQVRPFLLAEPPSPSPTFVLEIPAGTEVCGVFSKERTGRAIQTEYETKSRVRFNTQTLELPTITNTFEADLFEIVHFGSAQTLAEPEGRGRFRVLRLPTGGGETIYRFNYEQTFRLATGERFDLELFAFNFRGRGAVALDETVVLDEDYLTFQLAMQGVLEGNPVVSYSSCNYELLPRYEIDVALEGGSSIRLVERFQPSPNNVSTGPANLVHARLVLGGVRAEIGDYWRLVYAARRHNLDVTYWVELAPPLRIPGIDAPVRVVEVLAPEPPRRAEARVRYLGATLEELTGALVTSYSRAETVAASEVRFRRGDVDGDGSLTVRDAIALLDYLFQKGVRPSCLESADTNDDDRVAVTDAIVLVRHLFGEREPLPPPSECGVDPGEARVTCEDGGECEA